MLLKVVVVRDRAADTFAQPFFVPALGLAVRSFGDEVNRKDSNNAISVHPEDFDLYELGTFDDSAARFDLLDSPRCIARAQDYVRASVGPDEGQRPTSSGPNGASARA